MPFHPYMTVFKDTFSIVCFLHLSCGSMFYSCRTTFGQLTTTSGEPLGDARAHSCRSRYSSLYAILRAVPDSLLGRIL